MSAAKINMDAPCHIGDVNLYFIKMKTREQMVLGPETRATGRRVGKTTIFTVKNDSTELTPRQVMAAMRAMYEHIPSYDGCEMEIIRDEVAA